MRLTVLLILVLVGSTAAQWGRNGRENHRASKRKNDNTEVGMSAHTTTEDKLGSPSYHP